MIKCEEKEVKCWVASTSKERAGQVSDKCEEEREIKGLATCAKREDEGSHWQKEI